MIKKLSTIFFYCLLLIIVFNRLQFSQTADSLSYSSLYPFVVDSIKINGNELTKEFIILKELTFAIGDTITEKIANYNRERIYSLEIFNRVRLVPQRIDNKNILNINIEESWYIYPIPFINAVDDDLRKLSFGLFIKIKNFRGMDEELGASFSVGFNPSLFLTYYNPNIGWKENIFIRTILGYADIENQSPSAELLYGKPFSQKFSYIQFSIGKRIGLFHRIYLTTAFNYIETPAYFPKVNASKNRIDHRFDIGFGFEYDTRDLVQFPKDGIYTNLVYTFKGLGIDNINYSVAWFDFRKYGNVFDKLLAKCRFASRFTFGEDVPFYDYSILGLRDKIRGYFTKKIEGNNYYISKLEFYYPIIDELNIDLTFIPVIPDQLLSYRIGFYTQLFFESGAVQIKGKPLTFSDFYSGYGAGITLLILPYNVFRIDFALDKYRNLETIFSLGISF